MDLVNAVELRHVSNGIPLSSSNHLLACTRQKKVMLKNAAAALLATGAFPRFSEKRSNDAAMDKGTECL
jgi:hypothetical protein